MLPEAQIAEPVGIFGFGEEGRSTARFLTRQGCREVTVFDRKQPQDLPPGTGYAGEHCELRDPAAMRTLFRSAGIRPDAPLIKRFLAGGGRLTSQVETFFDLVPSERIIAVTGTLGKGTCCSILKAIFNQAGVPALLAGNIGLPVLEAWEEWRPGMWSILELSSFQLSTLRRPPHLAVVLRTTSEHLDWHTSREEYLDCKANLCRFQGAGDALIHHLDSEGAAWIATQAGGERHSFGAASDSRVEAERWSWHGMELRAAELALTGNFQLENMAAAVMSAVIAGIPPATALAAAREFRGLPHRLEFVREWQGRKFYDDSYATRPEAAIGALQTFGHTPLGLILGGSEKFADFGPLAAACASASHLRAIALIGATRERIAAELAARGAAAEIRLCQGLDDATAFLLETVPTGVILLSPACASFGLFENYKRRGEMFQELVRGLRAPS